MHWIRVEKSSLSQTFSISPDDSKGLAESWMQTSSELKSTACKQK
jgi:hypothetical protein